MDPNTPRLDASIRNILRPRLTADGFTGSGKNFRRQLSGWIHAISIGVSRYGGEFALDLGVQPECVPTDFQPDPKRIRAMDCEFRCRLTETGLDQWWPYQKTQPSMDAAVARATDVYLRIGRPFLAQFAEPHCPLTALTPDDLSANVLSRFGFQTTEVRAALVLGRLHKAQGLIERARQFATWGLSNLGHATALKMPFEQLLLD